MASDIVTGLKNLIATRFANNTNHQITEAKLREVSNTMVDNFSTAVEITWETFMNLYGMDEMRPGLYFLKDAGADGTGIYIRAIDNANVEIDATVIFYNPDYQGINRDITVLGLWEELLTPSAGDYCIRNGYHYLSLTGLAGYAPEGDGTNWQIVRKPHSSYIKESVLVNYDLLNDTVLSVKDKRGNYISDWRNFQWGNDFTTFNNELGAGGFYIINQRGYFIGNTINKSVVVYADETNTGNIIANDFSGSQEIECNFNSGKTLYACSIDSSESIVFDPDVDLSEKRIEDKFSDVSKEYDISGLTTLNITGDRYGNQSGVVILNSTNTTETINVINNLPPKRRIRVYATPGKVITFTGGSGLRLVLGSAIILTGSNYDWAEFELIGTNVTEVNRKKY